MDIKITYRNGHVVYEGNYSNHEVCKLTTVYNQAAYDAGITDLYVVTVESDLETDS